MNTVKRILLAGAMAGSLAGCHNQPKKPVPPPATTQEACTQAYSFFIHHDLTLERPQDMSAGCAFRVTAPPRLPKDLGKELAAAGWTAEGTAWVTPATRCTIQEGSSQGDSHPVHGSVGVSGGTHISPSFGIGIGIGSYSETPREYKLDCLPKRN